MGMNANWSVICLAAFLIASTGCNATVAAPSNSVAVNATNANSLATPTTNDATHTVVADTRKSDGEKISIEVKSESAVRGAFWGAFFGLLGGLCLASVIPVIKRWYLTKNLHVNHDLAHGGQFRCRVFNRGYFTIKNAVIYIFLPFNKNQTSLPPPGHNAFIRPDNFVTLIWDQLCWSVRVPIVNPLKVDIYAKEEQPFSPCALTQPGDLIIIPSEEGWPHPNNLHPNLRVFLNRGIYSGFLKVVSEDTNAKFFEITINPENNLTPIQIEPSSARRVRKAIEQFLAATSP
jgi:hypothetical protein